MSRGFTFIELLIVMTIAAILITVVTSNLLQPQRQVAKTGLTEQLVTDLKAQQNLAIVRDGNGDSFGVHISSTAYTLFEGTSYSANDSRNYVVTLDNNQTLTSAFANNDIVFSPLSGAITSYSAGHDTITITDSTTNAVTTLHLNTYGVVDSVN